jgi:hypothetical protein
MKKLWVNRTTLSRNIRNEPIEELVNYSVFITKDASKEDAIEQIEEFGGAMTVDILEIDISKDDPGFDIGWVFEYRKDSMKTVYETKSGIFLDDYCNPPIRIAETF